LPELRRLQSEDSDLFRRSLEETILVIEGRAKAEDDDD
jgi:hypothetical protein